MKSEDISLREFVEDKIAALTLRMEERMAAADKALLIAVGMVKETADKTERSVEHRLDGLNEFRGAMADQAKEMMPRNESQLQHRANGERLTALVDALSTLTARVNLIEGRRGGSETIIGYVVGALGAGVGLWGLLHK